MITGAARIRIIDRDLQRALQWARKQYRRGYLTWQEGAELWDALREWDELPISCGMIGGIEADERAACTAAAELRDWLADAVVEEAPPHPLKTAVAAWEQRLRALPVGGTLSCTVPAEAQNLDGEVLRTVSELGPVTITRLPVGWVVDGVIVIRGCDGGPRLPVDDSKLDAVRAVAYEHDVLRRRSRYNWCACCGEYEVTGADSGPQVGQWYLCATCLEAASRTDAAAQQERAAKIRAWDEALAAWTAAIARRGQARYDDLAYVRQARRRLAAYGPDTQVWLPGGGFRPLEEFRRLMGVEAANPA